MAAKRIAATLASVVALAFAGAASAHDFWLQPDPWRAEAGATLNVSVLVGHGPDRRRSPIPASRIVRFDAVTSGGRTTDLRPNLSLGAPAADAVVSLAPAGAYVLALETDDRAESHLPAARFNDYLALEGLTPAARTRIRGRRTAADGSENYSRHAKALVRIGPVDPAAQAAVTRPVGMTLEIVPERSPWLSPRPATFTVRIYYRGRLLPGALVKLTDLAHDDQPVKMQRSDQAGRATFAMPGKGSWLVNVIWTRPQPRDRLTDFETDFSSLSFGVTD